MKTLSGTISISRPQYSNDTKLIHINLYDNDSRCEVVEIRLSLEDFTEITVGNSQRPCVFDFNDSGVIGKVAEYKEEAVSWPKNYKDVDEVAATLAPFEVDGWKADKTDIQNHHRWVGDNQVRVGFRRYVEK